MKKIKIAVIGLRGFPSVQGGIETHCENLYPRLVDLGYEVTAYGRKHYIGNKPYHFGGVNLVPVSCPNHAFFETIIYTFFALIKAFRYKPDIIHFHAMGPSLFVPICRLLGYKVVSTHHGLNYLDDKWNTLAKWFLRLGEKHMAMANCVISVSNVISAMMRDRYNAKVVRIPNGINLQEKSAGNDYLKKWLLIGEKYVVYIGRFAPIKRPDFLLEAFAKVGRDVKLVLIGDSDCRDSYSDHVKSLAQQTKNVIPTGYLKGEELQQLLAGAECLILPSIHEGFSIVLLEALVYGVPCLVSDTATREIEHPIIRYFKGNDMDDLVGKIEKFENKVTESEKKSAKEYLLKTFDWASITQSTSQVYQNVMGWE
ncbi:glycosyltransferase family 4 protein [Teredinibacter sp. KSP-S5-2]|uniref:glycosyltransferase family 4 protein n=1 Tax=Teredinibacter sp. KSP-S5-2 TaxID=3034506 RepID=UPI00293532C3|nr:glycosyltransferase family 4 protein [Teredinibacter sp. KSP-S5-2]WNO10647.1 glycosyltransferase family 4 protein [Teredinibacter sp. KSP-S5-2]